MQEKGILVIEKFQGFTLVMNDIKTQVVLYWKYAFKNEEVLALAELYESFVKIWSIWYGLYTGHEF